MMHDAFIYKTKDAFYVDCDGQSQERLFLHLQTYNLRSKTSISMVPEDSELSVAFSLNQADEPFPCLAKLTDPRASWRMNRFLVNFKDVFENPAVSIREGRYNRERILAGVPEGPFEISARQAIPLEYNFDLMNAIDLHKGCYLGQELITRTLHRGVVRKRVFPLRFHRFDYETGEPEGFKEFSADSVLTANLDRQSELLPTAIQGDPAESDTFTIPKGKLRILSKNDAVGRLIVANGNIGLGMMRLEQLNRHQENLAVFDHIKHEWLMADVSVPAHLQDTLEVK
jgi:folate-binding protein YgfZ